MNLYLASRDIVSFRWPIQWTNAEPVFHVCEAGRITTRCGRVVSMPHWMTYLPGDPSMPKQRRSCPDCA